MSDPVEFLTARLAEVEAVITSSSSGKVGAVPAGPMFYHHGSDLWTRVGVDAAAALRLVAATREILAQHKLMDPADQALLLYPPRPTCNVCADWEARDYDGAPPLAWPCPTITALARGWGWDG